MKKGIIISVVFFLLIAFLPGLIAEEAFVIDHYQINMDVRENNSYKVTEILDVDFSSARHGIIRNIPIYFDHMYVPVSDISVEDHEYSVERGKKSVNIRIGSADAYVEGKIRYTISYLYDVGADKLTDMDEFNHNVIGTQWDTTIKSADFRITLPKPFNGDNVNCTSGKHGSTDNSGVKWTVDGTVISGRLLKPLSNFEGLTLALPLPEGYWVGAVSHREPGWLIRTVLGYPLYIFAIIVSFLLWFIKGRDNQLFPSVQFEPPEGLTPSEIGYIIDGQVDNKDVTSLILYWADRGYLAIDEQKTEKGKSKTLELIKLGQPGPEARSYERQIFKKLFSCGTGDRVTTEDLKNTFYKTIRWGIQNISQTFTKDPEKRVFARGTAKASIFTFILAVLPVFTIMNEAFRQAEAEGPLPVLSFFLSIFVVIPFMIIGKRISTKSSGDKGTTAAAAIMAAVAVTLAGVLSVFIMKISLYKFLAAIGSSAIAAFFTSIMSRRTEYGDRILEKVLGFREFIETAEKEKLEMMFESNPSYFYNILPYAMVLGLSAKWSAHFEGLAVSPPGWYRGYHYDRFNTRDFDRDLNGRFSSISSSMSSSPSSSGSSSSGGSSGGGSGGGGGSSW